MCPNLNCMCDCNLEHRVCRMMSFHTVKETRTIKRKGEEMTLVDNSYKEIIKAYETTVNSLLEVIDAQSKVIADLRQQSTFTYTSGSGTLTPSINPNPKIVY